MYATFLGFEFLLRDERHNDNLVNKCNEHTSCGCTICKVGSLSFGHVRIITQNNSENTHQLPQILICCCRPSHDGSFSNSACITAENATSLWCMMWCYQSFASVKLCWVILSWNPYESHVQQKHMYFATPSKNIQVHLAEHEQIETEIKIHSTLPILYYGNSKHLQHLKALATSLTSGRVGQAQRQGLALPSQTY